MRFIPVGILLFLSMLLVQSASAKQAETIDELAEMYSIDKCAACHEEQYNEWKTSSMGNSVIDPRVLRGWRTFIRLALDVEASLTRKDLRICLDCHVPQIKDGTDGLVEHIAELVLTAVEHELQSERNAAIKELSQLNLNCLGCHNIRGTGFGSPPEKNTIYVPDHIDGAAHEAAGYKTIQTDLLTKSDFCARCHHCPPSVPWEECPTLYTTYIDDFVEHGHKETCQACHMLGKQRSHKFLGPQNQDFLRSSVSLSMDARLSRYIDIYENKKLPAVVIKVRLANKAGHTIPHG